MKNSGFKNEKKLVKALNNHRFSDLNPNLQNLIVSSFQNSEGIIQCTLKAGNHKSDIEITINNETHSYSIKIGKGNSIHQESLYEFITFLTNKHQLKEPIKSYIQEFIWGDETINGLGKIENRISSRQFKKKYPQKVEAIQNYFNTIKPSLVHRFLISGSDSSSHAEYLYYGNVKKGYVCKTTHAIEWVLKQTSRATLHVGKLNFQAWNRNLKGKRKAEHKRGFVQIKWTGLKKDIQKIANQNNIVKLNPYLFQQLFTNNLLAAGASLYTKENKLHLNEHLLYRWGISKEVFFAHYKRVLDIPIDSLEHLNCQRCLQKIKHYAKNEIKSIVIAEMKHVNQPVNYYWLHLHQELTKSAIKKFNIVPKRKSDVAIVLRSV